MRGIRHHFLALLIWKNLALPRVAFFTFEPIYEEIVIISREKGVLEINHLIMRYQELFSNFSSLFLEFGGPSKADTPFIGGGISIRTV